LELAAVELDDSAGYCEAQAGAFGFGGVEGLEDFLLGAGRQARAVVANADHEFAAFGGDLDLDGGAWIR
jgi:hypothetical protein